MGLCNPIFSPPILTVHVSPLAGMFDYSMEMWKHKNIGTDIDKDWFRTPPKQGRVDLNLCALIWNIEQVDWPVPSFLEMYFPGEGPDISGET